MEKKPYENWNCAIEINEGIIKNLKYILYMTSLKLIDIHMKLMVVDFLMI